MKTHARNYLAGPIILGIAALAMTALLGVLIASGSVQASTGGISADGGTSGSSGGDRYDRLWRGLSDKNKAWARRTSECESGGDPKIHGGGGTYHGAFQFMLGTWRSAPKSPGGDPHKYRWKVQAVVAVYLKKRDGAHTHWPVCG
jgi:hypothetical protein